MNELEHPEAIAAESAIGIKIAALPIALHCRCAEFISQLRLRYANFLCDPRHARVTLDITIRSSSELARDEDIEVSHCMSGWLMRRGDFVAHWNSVTGRGSVQQTANPYSIDSALRIIHSLVLAEDGGFLLHSASVIYRGCAMLLTGQSGAGKTTITRLAPPNASRLSDEISYVRWGMSGYMAHGTPFCGELNTPGENTSAPIAGLYFLMHAEKNRIEPVSPSHAVTRLMRNILFFVEGGDLPDKVFQSACKFVENVPAFNLYFKPDPKVWEVFNE